MEVVASLSQGRTAAAQCGLFTHKSVPVIFEPPCINENLACRTALCRTQKSISYIEGFAAYSFSGRSDAVEISKRRRQQKPINESKTCFVFEL